jgi:Zn-dependent protease with chaperone function
MAAPPHPIQEIVDRGLAFYGKHFQDCVPADALTLLLMFFGRYFGGENGMLLALAFAAVMNFVSYFYSDKIALAMYKAQPVHARSNCLAPTRPSSASLRKLAFPCLRFM